MSTSLLSVRTRFAYCAVALAFLNACATTSNAPQRDARDPYESINRSIYRFNEQVDRVVLRPTARAYRAVLPEFVRTSVGNFFSNIGDVRSVLNNTLQGKFTAAYAGFGRIAINSTLGVLGLFDIASEAGIEKHDEDFGQTLGWYGVNPGPYIVLPLFGPSTARDTVGFAVDWVTDPVFYVDPSSSRYQLSGTRLVNRRAELLDATSVLETTLDPYQFIRDAYLQRRRNLIFDGNPPADKDAIIETPPTPAIK